MARITARLPAGPDRRPAGGDPLRVARHALPRGRRVCYRNAATPGVLSSRKSDLDQIAAPFVLPREAGQTPPARAT
ncbi:hypothetical protein [Burkholderia pseudomultivorans]|uniref:hypothetical protein n=1 Tax=Burkholderia pseudomultivorans TaxID=1207504 RepID=UPI000B0EA47F|nr:hypothetical protein [Burkholderia pseudomultivorans]